MATLPPDLQRAARDSYAGSLRIVFIAAACSTFVAYIIRLPVSFCKHFEGQRLFSGYYRFRTRTWTRQRQLNRRRPFPARQPVTIRYHRRRAPVARGTTAANGIVKTRPYTLLHRADVSLHTTQASSLASGLFLLTRTRTVTDVLRAHELSDSIHLYITACRRTNVNVDSYWRTYQLLG